MIIKRRSAFNCHLFHYLQTDGINENLIGFKNNGALYVYKPGKLVALDKKQAIRLARKHYPKISDPANLPIPFRTAIWEDYYYHLYEEDNYPW